MQVELTHPRVWLFADGLRIATDLVEKDDDGEIVSIRPMHAKMFPSGELHWVEHKQGGSVSAIPPTAIPPTGIKGMKSIAELGFWAAEEDPLLALRQ